MGDLDARHARQEVVDVVVAAQLAVGDDVDAGPLLVLERGLDGDLVDLVEVLAADAALVEVGLQSLQPLRHRVRADDGRRQRHGVSGCHCARRGWRVRSRRALRARRFRSGASACDVASA